MHVYECMCTYLCACVYISVCMCTYLCACVHICVHVYVSVCMCMYLCACVRICVHDCFYIIWTPMDALFLQAQHVLMGVSLHVCPQGVGW